MKKSRLGRNLDMLLSSQSLEDLAQPSHPCKKRIMSFTH